MFTTQDPMTDKVSDRYAVFQNDKLVRESDGQPVSRIHQMIYAQFRGMCLANDFSCMGAKASLRGGTHRSGLYGDLANTDEAPLLAQDLRCFISDLREGNWEMSTYVAFFDQPVIRDEYHFEKLLWTFLQALHDVDEDPWDPAVSRDTESVRFSYSFGGMGFFILGMSPAASRWARRFTVPTLVFNPHHQFDRLRELGRYDKFKNAIRKAEVRLQGSLNPNLADFGVESEAKQYSGRPAEKEWRCPLQVNKPKA